MFLYCAILFGYLKMLHRTFIAQIRLSFRAPLQLLQPSPPGIARIAARVGYESEAAFNKAFKRELGLPPSAWRAQQRQS